jgi:hypothetical protein
MADMINRDGLRNYSDFEADLVSAGFIIRPNKTAKCKICGSNADLFDVVDFNKTCYPSSCPLDLAGVPVYFHRCKNCDFVFTLAFDQFDSISWRRFVYNVGYYKNIDPEYEITRPKFNSQALLAACVFLGKHRILGVDYGGGNGAMAKLINDQAISYFTHDPNGESNVLDEDIGKFNLLSSFEVLEHTTDPQLAIREMLKFVGNKFVFIVSTQCSGGLIDENRRLSWSYVAPRNGHVSIYSEKSLRIIGESFSLEYLRISRGLHLFGKNIRLQPLKFAIGSVRLLQKLRMKALQFKR